MVNKKLALACMFGMLSFNGYSWAQDASEMSCAELWMARNQIYADTGYCFKTARAKAVFGDACFPPYGKMNLQQQQKVAEIKRWEAARYCPK
jgi:hypothetical protein